MHSCSQNHVSSLTLLFIPLFINLTPSSQYPPESPLTILTTNMGTARLQPSICGGPKPSVRWSGNPRCTGTGSLSTCIYSNPKPGAHKRRRNTKPHLWRMNVTSLLWPQRRKQPTWSGCKLPCAALPPASVRLLTVSAPTKMPASAGAHTIVRTDPRHVGASNFPILFLGLFFSPVLRVAGNA